MYTKSWSLYFPPLLSSLSLYLLVRSAELLSCFEVQEVDARDEVGLLSAHLLRVLLQVRFELPQLACAQLAAVAQHERHRLRRGGELLRRELLL